MTDLKTQVQVPKTADIKHLENVAADVAYSINTYHMTFEEQLFICAYCGDALSAVMDSGLLDGIEEKKKKSRAYALIRKFKKNPDVVNAIDAIGKGMVAVGIADASRLKLLLSEFANDETLDPKVRMQAIKQLSACYADFSEKVVIQSHHKEEHDYHFSFSGPKSNFIKHLEAQNSPSEAIDVTPTSTHTVTLDELL